MCARWRGPEASPKNQKPKRPKVSPRTLDCAPDRWGPRPTSRVQWTLGCVPDPGDPRSAQGPTAGSKDRQAQNAQGHWQPQGRPRDPQSPADRRDLKSDAPREMQVRSRGSLSAARIDLKGARQIQKLSTRSRGYPRQTTRPYFANELYNLYPNTTYRLGSLDIMQPNVGNQ